MRKIKYTNRFKRDYKREKGGQHGKKLDAVLMEAVNMLAADALLPRRYFDHPRAITSHSAISSLNELLPDCGKRVLAVCI